MKPSARSTTCRNISTDGVARLQAHLRAFPPYANATVSDLSLSRRRRATSPTATASQWALVQEIQAAVPDAQRAPSRAHRCRGHASPRRPSFAL